MSAKKTTALAVLLVVAVMSYILACSQATWSPDGKRIAFVDPPFDHEDGCSLMLWDGEEGAVRLLLQVDSFLSSPGWSPDGKTLAVMNYGEVKPPKAAEASSAVNAESATNPEKGAESKKQIFCRLVLVDPTGGKPLVLAEEKVMPMGKEIVWEPCPQWTVGGKMIVWAIPFTHQVRLVEANTGQLVKAIDKAIDPVLSPSRKMLAMFEMADGDKPVGVDIFDLEKMERRSLLKFETPGFRVESDEGLAWSPDSSQLLIAGRPMIKAEDSQPGAEKWVAFESSGLWTVNVIDGKPKGLTLNVPPQINSINWSAKGDRLALTTNPSKNEGKESGGDLGVWLMKSDGSDLRRIDSARGQDEMAFYPAFSSDGVRLCYQVYTKTPKAVSLVVYDLVTGTAKVVYAHCCEKLPAFEEAVKNEAPAESVVSAAPATPATSAAPAK